MPYEWHGWWMGWMWIFWVILIVVIVWIALRAASASGRVEVRRTPEDILRERYARGEIDTEEYQRRLEVLRHGSKVA